MTTVSTWIKENPFILDNYMSLRKKKKERKIGRKIDREIDR